MLDSSSFEAFRASALAAGFDEALVREWRPLQEVAEHTHPFAADAVVTQGRMWLTCGDETRELRSGDRFALAANVPHSERYGPDGAVYWVARRGR